MTYEEQLDNLASLINGRWYRTETLNSRGERTERYVIERDITHSSSLDATGSNTSDS